MAEHKQPPLTTHFAICKINVWEIIPNGRIIRRGESDEGPETYSLLRRVA